MTLRLWRLHITLNTDCARCALPRRNAGHRISYETCQRLMLGFGSTCANPNDHHRFRWFRP